MYACRSVSVKLRAGQPRSAGDAAKSSQFIGQFSWVTGETIVLKGLIFNENCYFVMNVMILNTKNWTIVGGSIIKKNAVMTSLKFLVAFVCVIQIAAGQG